MHVKTDTKEKFTVITVDEPIISANMADSWDGLLLPYLSQQPPHVVLNLELVQTMDSSAGGRLCQVQQTFYENHCSMVICCLKPDVEKMLDENEWLEVMNITPSESEAWDIVQMEEIERELMEGFDEESGT